MSRGAGISLQPLALDQGARDAVRLADSFEDALDSLAGLPLGGLPPSSRGRVGQTIAHARQSVRDAGMEARGQGAELRRRAALARAADAGGGFGFGAAVNIAFKLWGLSEHPRSAIEAASEIAKRVSVMPTRMLRPSDRAIVSRIRKWHKLLKLAHPWTRPMLPLGKLPKGLLKLAKPLKNRLPGIDSVVDLVANVRSGMSKSEAALRGLKDVAIDAAAVGAGVAACGTLSLTGVGAAACPVIAAAVIGTLAKKGSDKLIDAEQKQLDKERRQRQREREKADALRRHPTGRCEIEHTQARPLL